MKSLIVPSIEIPEMMSGAKLRSAMTVLPAYDDSTHRESQAVRLMRLSDLYRLYIPSDMSVEIYSKLYLALLRSLQKKGTIAAVKQTYQNNRMIQGQDYRGIIGGSDSFTIIGTSGIGKSSAISRTVDLMTERRVLEMEETLVVPCVTVQCPFDSSVKGLLLEILRKVDEVLESRYYTAAIRARATTDMLIGSVSQVALNHIGLLIVDEIQNVVNAKSGRSLIGSLTQLINNSGISIGMVGTPECIPFFEQAMQLARRSVGLQYSGMAFDDAFEEFCKTVFDYQYTKHRTEITPAVISWLYEHSAGVASVVVSLIHDAQEIAILNGREALDLSSLCESYDKRMSLLHSYIQPTITTGKQTSRTKKTVPVTSVCTAENVSDDIYIAELAKKAKTESLDMVALLKEGFPIEEVAI